jgi:hypothetical protein
LLTSHIAPVDGHQVRLRLRRSTIARLIDLQAQAVAAGIQKPSYSEILDQLVAGTADRRLTEVLPSLAGNAA